jgi:hypothetical protein
MAWVTINKKNENGKYLVSPKVFYWYLITSTVGVIMIIVMSHIYLFNGGVYFPPTDMVMFYGKDYSPDELHYIANHEIGHHVWFKYLNDEQRAEYNSIFKNSKYFITEYSKMNVEENFAEEYAFFMACNKGKHCVSKDRSKFFDDYILGYKVVVLD